MATLPTQRTVPTDDHDDDMIIHTTTDVSYLSAVLSNYCFFVFIAI